jgi:citrate lyase subunit beta/citryl-CoA lyase|tara:strand:+ start:748 stop:1647 length:900 start_codon:yes stop_codon:yes gene_type:complete
LNIGNKLLPIAPLFVPGNRADMLNKVTNFNARWIVPDLEDSVPVTEKETARFITKSAIPDLVKAGKKVVPRVNSLKTVFFHDDLKSVVGEGITGISIGKIDSDEDVYMVEKHLSETETEYGLEVGGISLLIWIETAKGLSNVTKIFSASERIKWAAFGAEDFCADMGILRDTDMEINANESNLIHPRSSIAIAAKVAEIHAIDTPYTSYKDKEGLLSEVKLAKAFGYRGKFAIHPDQVKIINESFYPNDEEIRWANKIVSAAKRSNKSGIGAIGVDGKMIDTPVILRAENILKLISKSD